MAHPVPTAARPSLLRRLAAVLYDGLLLIALWMAASALWLAVRDGEAVPAGEAWFRLYLLAIAWAFLVGFWVRGGRTLGMLAWRLRLVAAADGGPVTLRQASARFFAALLSWLPAGAGYLWALVDRDGLTWHDRLSGTRLVLEPKPRRSH
jgi:uncharacterized RDD family membrane protein YckC